MKNALGRVAMHGVRSWIWLASFVFAVASTGCGVDEAPSGAADGADSLRSQSSPLYLTGAKWAYGDVYVCWLPESTQRSDFAARSAEIRAIAEDTWGRVANIAFIGWGPCGASRAGWVGIRLMDSGRSNAGDIGYVNADITMSLNVNSGNFRGLIIHEFGHTLGFRHEFVRPDNTDPGCPLQNGESVDTGGDSLGTPYDGQSIMASTGYCQNNANLSPWDIIGVQNAYGRKPAGSIAGLGGLCVNIQGASTSWGTPIIGFPCTNGGNDTWQYTPANRHFGANINGTSLFLNVSGGAVSSNSSTPLISWGNASTTNEQFTMPDARWITMGDRCVVAPSATSGAQLEIRACGTSPNERWTFFDADNRRIRLVGSNLCVNVPNASATDGNILQLYPCGPSTAPYSNELFQFTARGEMKWGGKCFNVLGGWPTSGSKVGLWPCGGTEPYYNSVFHLSGPVRSLGQCMDMLGGTAYWGVPIGMYPCVNSGTASNQVWEYYWKDMN